MSWIEFPGGVCAAIALVAKRFASRACRRAESENLALVRRRRALRDELQRVVPNDLEARRLAQAAARHLGVSGSSPEALQAAIERGTHQSRIRTIEERNSTPDSSLPVPISRR